MLSLSVEFWQNIDETGIENETSVIKACSVANCLPAWAGPCPFWSTALLGCSEISGKQESFRYVRPSNPFTLGYNHDSYTTCTHWRASYCKRLVMWKHSCVSPVTQNALEMPSWIILQRLSVIWKQSSSDFHHDELMIALDFRVITEQCDETLSWNIKTNGAYCSILSFRHSLEQWVI